MTAGLPRGGPWAPQDRDRELSPLIICPAPALATEQALSMCLLDEYLEKEREEGKSRGRIITSSLALRGSDNRQTLVWPEWGALSHTHPAFTQGWEEA